MLEQNNYFEYLKEPPTVRVNIDQSFTNGQGMYQVKFDARKYAAMLVAIGVPRDRIVGTSVSIKKGMYGQFEGTEMFVGGEYIPSLRQVNVFPDLIYQAYINKLHAIPFIQAGDISQDQKFSYGMRTKRIPDYLRAAPRQRGRKFVEKLLESGLSYRADQIIFHEVGHLKDHQTRSNVENIRSGISAITRFNNDVMIGIGTALSTTTALNRTGINPLLQITLGMLTGSIVGFVVKAYNHDPEVKLNKYQKSMAEIDANNLMHKLVLERDSNGYSKWGGILQIIPTQREEVRCNE